MLIWAAQLSLREEIISQHLELLIHVVCFFTIAIAYYSFVITVSDWLALCWYTVHFFGKAISSLASLRHRIFYTVHPKIFILFHFNGSLWHRVIAILLRTREPDHVLSILLRGWLFLWVLEHSKLLLLSTWRLVNGPGTVTIFRQFTCPLSA